MNFYPYEKCVCVWGGGGGVEVLAMLKGGHKHFWASLYTVA